MIYLICEFLRERKREKKNFDTIKLIDSTFIYRYIGRVGVGRSKLFFACIYRFVAIKRFLSFFFVVVDVENKEWLFSVLLLLRLLCF